MTVNIFHSWAFGARVTTRARVRVRVKARVEEWLRNGLFLGGAHGNLDKNEGVEGECDVQTSGEGTDG